MLTAEEIELMMREINSFNETLENLDQLTRLENESQGRSQRLVFIQAATINTEIQTAEGRLEGGELARNPF